MGTCLLLQKPKMSEETTHKELKCNESQEKKRKRKKTHIYFEWKIGVMHAKMVTEQALASSEWLWVLRAEQKSMFACDAKISCIINAFYSTLYSSVHSPNWPFDPMHFLCQITRVLAYWLGSRHLKSPAHGPTSYNSPWFELAGEV